MTMDEEMELCPNCHKRILKTNFVMHELHCRRSLVTCPKCKETIPKTELTEHMDNAHKVVMCQLCKEQVEKWQLENHERDCSKRPVICAFCEIEFAIDALAEHEDYCGSRTDRCEECGQYVMLKLREQHLASGHAPTEKDKLVNNNNFSSFHNNFDIGTDFVQQPKVTNVVSDGYARQSPVKRTNDMPQVNTNFIDQFKDSEKSGISDLETDSSSRADAYDEMLAFQIAQDDFDSVNPIDRPDILGHETFVSPLGSLSQEFGLNQQEPTHHFSRYRSVDPETVWTHHPTDDLLANFLPAIEPSHSFIPDSHNTYTDDDGLPCEFCGELYPADLLIQHQSGCRPDIAHGLLEMNEYVEDVEPNKVFVKPVQLPERSTCSPNHSPKKLPYTETTNVERMQSSFPEQCTEELVTMLPCEFCNGDYPDEVLEEHQKVCYHNPDAAEREFLAKLEEYSKPRKGSPPHKTNAEPLIPVQANPKANSPPKITSLHTCPPTTTSTTFASSVKSNNSMSPEQHRRASFPTHSKPPSDFNFSDLLGRQSAQKPTRELTQSANRPSFQSSTADRNHVTALPPRGRNVPIRVMDHQQRPSAEDKRQRTTVSPTRDARKMDKHKLPSSGVNTYLAEMRNALQPVGVVDPQLVVTGTRPKLATLPTRSPAKVVREPNLAHARQQIPPAKRSTTNNNVPSYCKKDGKLEEAFLKFMAEKNAQFHAQQQNPSRTVGNRQTQLPPISRTGAVPKKPSFQRKSSEE